MFLTACEHGNGLQPDDFQPTLFTNTSVIGEEELLSVIVGTTVSGDLCEDVKNHRAANPAQPSVLDYLGENDIEATIAGGTFVAVAGELGTLEGQLDANGQLKPDQPGDFVYARRSADGGTRKLSGGNVIIFVDSVDPPTIRVNGTLTLDITDQNNMPETIDPIPFELAGEVDLCDINDLDLFPPRL